MVGAVAAAASVAASIWSEAQAQSRQASSEKEAQRILDEARAEINALTPPDPKEQEVFFQQLQSAGDLKPTLETTVSAGPSAAEGISTDPGLQQAQMNALAKMQQVGAEGLTAEDRFALNQIQSSNRQQERGAREAIMQSAQRQGMGGSSNALLAQLQAQQSAADRNSMQGMGQASIAQQRALDAMQRGGQLAGDIRSQSFNEQNSVAQARDAMAKFNSGLMADTQTRNVGAINNAADRNLNNKQRIADANVGLKNDQQMYNKGLIQQKFDNDVTKAGMQSGAAQASAGQRSKMGQQQADGARRWGQVATNTITGAQNIYDQRNKNKDA